MFRLKRSGEGGGKTTSKQQVSESDSKSHKSVAAGSKSSTSSGPTAASSPAAPSIRTHAARERSTSVDMTAWMDKECPLDSRMVSGTTNTLSISRSGRYKNKNKQRARLFSEDFIGSPDDQSNSIAHLKTSQSTAASEVRQAVQGTKDDGKVCGGGGGGGGGAQNGRKSSNGVSEHGSNQSSPRSPKWSTTPNSTDL